MIARRTHHYVVHGLRIAIACDQPAVAAALAARLRHFAAPPRTPVDLHFEFRGVPAQGRHVVEPPPGAVRPVYDPPAGAVVYSEATDQLYITYEKRVRVLCDAAQGRVQVSIHPSAADHLWLLSHPLFTLPLIELLKRRGRYSLHAAGGALHGRGLLFPGASGAGKSTLALALLRAGWAFLGDDVLFLSADQAGLRVLAFPDEIDVTADTARWFPEVQAPSARPRGRGWPKRPVCAEVVYGGEVVWECRPAVLVFPRVAHTAQSVIRPLRREDALLELVPNVLLTESRAAQAHLDALAELVRFSECYRLETGRDLDTLPRHLQALVE